jgi:hypothetical protein
MSGSPGARKERVTGRTAQIESRGECAYGLDVRSPSFPALQRADAMNREPRDRRELLLGVARRLAKGLQLRAE